tara:strand:+ start:6533 stop:7351 length:819 start_codon:yes stop_codon:yes gene_type:complete
MIKIIVFANYAYKDILKLWLRYISNFDLKKNVLIIALDKEIIKFLVDYDLEIIDAPYNIAQKGIKNFWKFRCEMFLEIYKKYGSFIHSDVDAIWLKNPLNYLSECPGDLLFSQGTVFPRNMFNKYGFVACCGFFMVRKSNASSKFLNELLKGIQKDKDDQVTVNKILMKNFKSFNFKDNYKDKANLKNGENFLIKCSNYPVSGNSRKVFNLHLPLLDNLKFGNDQKLSFALLPHKLFTRTRESISSSTIIAHPLAPKDNIQKIQMFKDLNIF